MYHYQGEWFLSSSSLPEANGRVSSLAESSSSSSSYTFSSLFWEIWQKRGYPMPGDTSKCYMFELVSSFNRIVVRYSEDNIVLHGCRDITTLRECDPVEIAKTNGWDCVRTYPIRSLQGIYISSSILFINLSWLSYSFIIFFRSFSSYILLMQRVWN